MRALRQLLAVPAFGLALTLLGCGPSGGGSEAPARVDVGKLGEPVKGAAPVPVPSPNPVPADKKLQEDAPRIVAEVGKLPPSPAAATEGLEAAAGWKLADWEDPGTSRKVEIGRGGNALIHLSTAGGPKGKTALLLTRDLSLAEKGAMRLTVYNPGPAPVRMAVAFWFSENWVYYESQAQDVEAGAWKALCFDLAAGGYKTESSKWAYSASLWKRDATKQLAVLLFAGGKAGAVFIDGTGVDLGPAPAARPNPEAGRTGPEARPGPGRGRRPEPKPADPQAEKKDEPPKGEKQDEPKPGAKADPAKNGLFGQPPPEDAPAP